MYLTLQAIVKLSFQVSVPFYIPTNNMGTITKSACCEFSHLGLGYRCCLVLGIEEAGLELLGLQAYISVSSSN